MKRNIILLLLILSFSSCFKERRSNNAAIKMQDFVIEISKYARERDPNFIIIPQNGIELVFQETDMSSGVNMNYINAIDGLGVEELFYNGGLSVDNERLEMLQEVKSYVSVLVADYINDNAYYSDVVQRNETESFLYFPRESGNYDYMYIPDSIPHENANDIERLADAQNYLYLINPSAFTSKQDYLNSLAATNYDLIIMDMDYQEQALTATEVASLKTKANGGMRLLISYMNVGAAESWRYYWEEGWTLHHPGWLKKPYDGYEDEIWVKFWKDDWKEIIYGNENAYIQHVLNAGFDGAYLDNVEAYYFLFYD